MNATKNVASFYKCPIDENVLAHCIFLCQFDEKRYSKLIRNSIR